jgi:hypothetical protein
MKKTLKINSIFGGQAPSRYYGAEGTFDQSLSIDPDFPIASSAVRTSGFVVPIGMSAFSGAQVTSHVVSIINNPKNTLTYVVLSNGRLISYDSALGTETLVGTVSGGAAVSGTYYNNYIYIFKPTNVSRYGPLNNSPSLTDDVWTGATLGTQSALTNTTYPSFNSVSIPNHIGHVHGDNSMYFTDFANGQGMLHRINTKKVTNEGDTNGTTVPSAYNVLDLPFGFYPTDIESFSTSVMIIGNYSSDGTINQGKSAFILWDPTNTSTFYLGPVFLEDPLATALLNVNGRINIWSGNGQNGFRISKYLGGESVTDIALFEEGFPPFATAVDAIGNKVIWGGTTTTPATSACVWSYGSKDSRLPNGVQNIIKTTSAGATPIVTALKYVQQSSNIQPKAVVAWRDGTTRGIDQYSATGTLGAIIRWTFNIGQKFNLTRIRIPFGGAVAANTTITPKVWFDDLSSSKSPTVINNTNYPSSRHIIYKTPELKDYIGKNNFTLEFAFSDTNPLPIALPILIDVEVWEDENDR